MSLEESQSPCEPVELNGFEFGSSKLGCSQLVTVLKLREQYCGKLISNIKQSEFLQLEGVVHKVLRAHPHPSILQPVCITTGKDVSGIILPAVGEDLHTVARNAKGLREREAKRVFLSIVSAVQHCHKHRIVIRDLRLGKIFYRKDTGDAVLADLDGAQAVSRTAPFFSDRKGSPAFVSPEVVVSQAYDGAAADMWALGVILYLLLTGMYPFRDSHPANLFHKIQQGHSAVFFPPSMSEAARDLIRRLLVKEPHLRMTADELAKDLWFAAPTMQPPGRAAPVHRPAAARPVETPAAPAAFVKAPEPAAVSVFTAATPLVTERNSAAITTSNTSNTHNGNGKRHIVERAHLVKRMRESEVDHQLPQ